MLEELGQPYDIKLLRLSEGDNMKPDYLTINPMAKVPALKHGDTVITEGAAICTYLADEFPDAKLNIPIGTPRRGMLGYGDFDTVMNVVAQAIAKGPWLMGEQFTAADVIVGANLRFGMMFKMIPERKKFIDYAARPAAQRAEAKDKGLAA
jgi:glutathione S-transferase